MNRRLPPSTWMPDNWAYAAEGGKHVLFRYSGTDIDFSGHLLRIAKCDLATSFHAKINSGISSSSSARTCKVIEFMEESASSSQIFHRKIVQPLIGHPYLDLARLVRLPGSCCAELYTRTLAQRVIPQSRLSSWKLDSTKAREIMASVDSGFHRGVKATLLRDHTHLSHHPSISAPVSPSSIANNIIIGSKSNNNAVLSVEIKPKAGYITASPFVLPEHRCKYYRTRYSLQQELMQKGYVQKGWLRKLKGEEQQNATKSELPNAFSPSNYSPLDLFSGNKTQIQQALNDLSQNMQNNFRVSCDGRQVFGEYETPSKNECQQVLNDIFHYSENDARAQLPDPKSTLLDVINNIVSTVLDRESLLSNMLSMQQLDVIDGDGAVTIYERLVQLYNGEGSNNAEAEKVLDEAALVARDGLRVVRKKSSFNDSHNHLDSTPYTRPECDSLDKLLDESVQFQAILRKNIKEGSVPDHEKLLNASRAKCIECANALSKEACIYLLQNWLLSLALCDVSFFVTFRILTDQGQGVSEEHQSCEHGGIASCCIPDDGASASRAMLVQYEVKVVDCDPKPAKKLRGRREVESKFRLINNSF